MANKKKSRKKKVARKKASRTMKVVSLKSALHQIRKAEHRIKARTVKRRRRKNPELACGEANPARHYPPLKGRGRPQKVRTFKLETRLANGMKNVIHFKGTKAQAERNIGRIFSRTWKGSAVKEVVLDDGRR